MAAVIGSRAEHRRFFDDAHKFAETFHLDGAETASLIEMGPDLGSLTAGFVRKREGYLRMNANETLEILGQKGDELLAEFVDTHPMPEWHRDEAGTFGQFLIDRATEMQDGSVTSQLIVEMARYEKFQHDSFWEATVRDRSDEPTTNGGSRRAIRLRAGATVAEFGWDMRLVLRYGFDRAGLFRPDPCHLLLFHIDTRSDFRVMRLQPTEVLAIRAMRAGVAVDTDVVVEALPAGVDLDRLLNRFLWQEVLEWQ